jgi:hypothetical protein
MTIFLHMSTKYHSLKYFVSKHVLVGLMYNTIVMSRHSNVVVFKYFGDKHALSVIFYVTLCHCI